MTRRSPPILVLTILAACGADPSSDPGPSIDLRPSGDTLVAEVLHTLNGDEGVFEFGDAVSVDFGPEKSVVVADRLQHAVLVFDSLGNLQRRIGRPGQGPGELQSPLGVGVYEDGTVMVIGGARGLDAIRAFSWDGSSLDSWQVAFRGQARPWQGVFADDPPAVLDWHYNPNRGESLASANTLGVIPVRGSGVLVPTESRLLPLHFPKGIPISAISMRLDSFPHPYSQGQLWSVGAGRLLAYVSQDTTELVVQEVFDRGSEVITRIRLPIRGGGRRLANRERAEEYIRSWHPDAELGPIDPIPFLPVYGVYVDDSDRIWVNTRPLFEITEGHEVAEVMVFRPEDTQFDVVQVPRHVQPHAPHFRAQGDRAIAVTQDALDRDVLYVLRLRSL